MASAVGTTGTVVRPIPSTEAPLFRSAIGAVAWAYETVSRVPVKSVSIYQMGKPRVPSRLGLSPDEAHAQAAMILSLVERTLEPIELAYVRAKFGRQFEALVPLRTMVLAAWPTGVHSTRAAEKVLLMYMGEPIGLRALRTDMGKRMADVMECKRKGFDALDTIHRRTVGKLDEALRASRVVGSEN